MNVDWRFLALTWRTKFQFVRIVVNRFGEGNEFKENRRGDPRKVDKSNGIEIQINAALNDAYRIPRPWKGRKRERKDPVRSRRKECRKEMTTDDVFAVFESIDFASSRQSTVLRSFNRHWFDIDAILSAVALDFC